MMHIPVLLKEVLFYLDLKEDDVVADLTVDGGGHSLEILKFLGKNGKLLAIDWDENLINEFKEKIKRLNKENKVIVVNDNYKNLKNILLKHKIGKVNKVLIDLGFSSFHLESNRGFSFLKDEPLLMTYHQEKKPLYQYLSELSENDLARIIKDYGEEKYSKFIAKNIKRNLPILTTAKLVEIIRKSVPAGYLKRKIHFATKTFQALRIFVNEELSNLLEVLKILPDCVTEKARVVIISFHSLEDRIVKKQFVAWQKNNLGKILTKKPIRPHKEEILKNKKSRSAKLRVFEFY